MKRILCLLLCLLMLFSVTACKPDNVTYPSEIINPQDQPEETPSEETPETQEPSAEETPADEEEEPAPEEEPKEEPSEEEAPEEEAPVEEETKEPATAIPNPLATADFTPSSKTASTLTFSGIVKQSNAKDALKNRTIVLYTANDQPAFTYMDENGKTVTEWQWMENAASENGFILKYTIKSKATSLKSQRVALYAGKKLSLVQMGVDELALGLSLSRSAADFLDTAATTFGISKSILNQSNHKLFAPVGNANTLWYNTALMPENTDPQTLSSTNAWTVEQFKAAYNHAVEQKALPLLMEETLAWATLGGRSPLTLLDGKLDSNIHAAVTRTAWDALRVMNSELTPFVKEEGSEYTVKGGKVAFTYTNLPEASETVTLNYAPLPSLADGTAGTVTYAGTFLALPKYMENQESIYAALTFAELWCNRYTEARAAKLQALGIRGEKYGAYCALTESAGHLILHDSAIEKTVADYLAGLYDPALDMEAAYTAAEDRLKALIALRNIYY